jgi:hypothetical protein
VPAHAQLAVQAFTLHLLLQRAQCLVDIVVADLNLDDGRSPRRKGDRKYIAVAVSTDAAAPIAPSLRPGNIAAGRGARA